MNVVPAIPHGLLTRDRIGAGFRFTPEPGDVLLVPLRFIAAVLLPLDIRLGSEDAGAFLAKSSSLEEWADVEAHAVEVARSARRKSRVA